MQFKTNHSPGPFVINAEDEFENCIILDSEGYKFAELWSTSSDVVDTANMNLLKAAPSMLKYIMDRAKYLYSLTLKDVLRKPRPRPMDRDDEWEELEKILAILEVAGVEVVEK